MEHETIRAAMKVLMNRRYMITDYYFSGINKPDLGRHKNVFFKWISEMSSMFKV